MDLQKLKDTMVSAKMDEVKSAARLEILEKVIADFYRLYLERKDQVSLVDGLEQMSRKLLDMQAMAMNDRDAAAAAMADMQRGIMEQMRESVRVTTEAVDGAQEPPDATESKIKSEIPSPEFLEHLSKRASKEA